MYIINKIEFLVDSDFDEEYKNIMSFDRWSSEETHMVKHFWKRRCTRNICLRAMVQRKQLSVFLCLTQISCAKKWPLGEPTIGWPSTIFVFF